MSELIVLCFPEASVAEGNRFATSLADDLRDLDPTLVLERQKQNPQTQDFGATRRSSSVLRRLAPLAKV
jgi:hypothetical protein